MPKLRKLLNERHAWFETCLSQLAEIDGYGDLSPPLVQFFSHIGREPVRLGDIAAKMNVSRQWAQRLAKEGEGLGLLELDVDPNDRRAMILRFSDNGWRVVRLAAARMTEIELELAERIGRENVDKLMELLALDWGPAEIPQPESSAAAFSLLGVEKKRAGRRKQGKKARESRPAGNRTASK